MKMSIFKASSGDVLQEAIGVFTGTEIEAILDLGERNKAERLLDRRGSIPRLHRRACYCAVDQRPTSQHYH